MIPHPIRSNQIWLNGGKEILKNKHNNENIINPKQLYQIDVEIGASWLPSILKKININAHTNGQAKPIINPGKKLRLLTPVNVGWSNIITPTNPIIIAESLWKITDSLVELLQKSQ